MTDPNESLPPTTTREWRRRHSDRPQKGENWFKLMAAIGGVILLVAIGLEMSVAVVNAFTDRTIAGIEIPHSVFIVGMIFGFVGFFGLSPKRAREGGDFLVSASERLITVVRTGRRKSDAVASVVATAAVVAPVAPVAPAPPEIPLEPEPEDHGPQPDGR